jgi:hypothetical protein
VYVQTCTDFCSWCACICLLDCDSFICGVVPSVLRALLPCLCIFKTVCSAVLWQWLLAWPAAAQQLCERQLLLKLFSSTKVWRTAASRIDPHP